MIDKLLELVDQRLIIESSFIALGSSISAILYYVQYKYNNKADKIDNALYLELDNNLKKIVCEAPYSTIPYVAINGNVNCDGKPLACSSLPEVRGVFWEKFTTEHKDVWREYLRSWQSVDQKISTASDSIPFHLRSNSKYPSVHVVHPEKSNWFPDCLDVVHDAYMPQSQSVMDSIVGFVSGERLRGYTTTEKMLRLGSKLCVIGKIVCEDNTLKIQPPDNGYGEFVISKLSRSDIVSDIRSIASVWKGLCVIMGISSAVAIFFIAKRLFKKWRTLQVQRRTEAEMQQVRLQRMLRTIQDNRQAESDQENTCVVCLTNPRECILLECGHVCVCVDCLEALPSPKECPVCRSSVVRTLPIFVV